MSKYKILFLLTILVLGTGRVGAQTPSSSNYQVPESSFSSGSEINAGSANFSAQGSAGILAVGQADSTSYDARAGFITPQEEFLELVVQTNNVDLGILDPSTTGVGTGLFYVRSYINGNYIVQTASPSLTSEGGSVIDAMNTAGASSQGTEQFGMNLVANTSPAVQGTDPVADPSTAFANGEAATGYDTSDTYKYTQGDVIAQSGSIGNAWGRTNFTISYIANVSGVTPAGIYEMDHDLVLVSTY